MFGKSLRRTVLSIGAASMLVPAAALPANAAATEGVETVESSWCVPVDEWGLTICSSSKERTLEVHTPTGRALFRSTGTSTMTTTYDDGTVETSAGSHRVQSVFSFWLDPLIFDTTMVSIDGTTTRTLPDGTTCTFDDDLLAVHDRLVRGGTTVTCTQP
ncbi:hypothetical protein ACFUTU_13545 [Arthrobacter sp. NPDC057388]|uniref:hypothetical protein n=1 Tax=Arthrobacter sp. NPDC057388 TaxID=3346116 RepID=UPI0036447CB2